MSTRPPVAMLRSLLLAAAVVSLGASGCAMSGPSSTANASTEPPIEVAMPDPVPMSEGTSPADGGRVAGHGLGPTFRLPLGESVQREGQPIAFVRVVEDSRCPEGVTCVWGGRVVVDVRIGDEIVQMVVPYSGQKVTEVSIAERGMAQVELVGVHPYPGSAEAEAGAAPELELTVRHAGS